MSVSGSSLFPRTVVPRDLARYPTCSVEPDAIYVRDGTTYTSADVTAGIDLALALVEDDHART
jgi:transcriptional regulator GlxA family with amidase domain